MAPSRSNSISLLDRLSLALRPSLSRFPFDAAGLGSRALSPAALISLALAASAVAALRPARDRSRLAPARPRSYSLARTTYQLGG